MSEADTSSPAPSMPTWFWPVVFAYGGALVAVGVVGTAIVGLSHWTALIPAILGALALLAGHAGRSGHAPATLASLFALAVAAVALLGTVGALPRFSHAVTSGAPSAGEVATIARALTALLSVGFIVMTVRMWWTTRTGW